MKLGTENYPLSLLKSDVKYIISLLNCLYFKIICITNFKYCFCFNKLVAEQFSELVAIVDNISLCSIAHNLNIVRYPEGAFEWLLSHHISIIITQFINCNVSLSTKSAVGNSSLLTKK